MLTMLFGYARMRPSCGKLAGVTTREAYAEYLLSEHWRELRRAVITRDGGKCTRCPSRQQLQAHHKFYRARWEDSEPKDLVTLCNWCHEREHGVHTARFLPPEKAVKLVKRIRSQRKLRSVKIWRGDWSC